MVKRQLPERAMDLLMDIAVPVHIRFGKVRMPLERVLELKDGAIVELDQEPLGEVDVLVNNRVIARGEIVEVDGEYGVRISRLEGAGAGNGSRLEEQLT